MIEHVFIITDEEERQLDWIWSGLKKLAATTGLARADVSAYFKVFAKDGAHDIRVCIFASQKMNQPISAVRMPSKIQAFFCHSDVEDYEQEDEALDAVEEVDLVKQACIRGAVEMNLT